ncbi:hypothetical protein HDU97_002161 [Phlyctochytrium planicorne]|nr:hypothetical protein HDU97_002161 [Phlyctochytrium planicorne]
MEFDATEVIRMASLRKNTDTIQRSYSKLDPVRNRLEIHVGITFGDVQNVVLGSLKHRLDYIVAGTCLNYIGNLLTEASRGDVVNQAARLLGVATPKYPIVCDTLTMTTSAGFNYNSLGRFHLKGIEDDVEVWNVESTADGERQTKRKQIIGYKDERMQILRELDSWQDGDCNPLVLVQGPSGIGKSTLQQFLMGECAERKQLLCLTRISKESQLIPFSALRDVFMFILNEAMPLYKAIYDRNLHKSTSLHTISSNETDQIAVVLKSILEFLDEDPDFYPVFAPFFPRIPMGETNLTSRLPDSARKGFTIMFATSFIKAWVQRVHAVFIFDDIQKNPLLVNRPSSEIHSGQLESIMSSPNLLHLILTGFKTDDVEDFLLDLFQDLKIQSVDPEVTKGSPILLQTNTEILQRNNCFKQSGNSLVFHPEKMAFVTEFLDKTLSQAMMMQFDRLQFEFQLLLRYASICGQYINIDPVVMLLPGGHDITYWKDIIKNEDKFSFIEEDQSGGFFFRHISIQTAIYESLSFTELMSLHNDFALCIEKFLQNASASLRTSALPGLYYHCWRANDLKKKIQYAEELGVYYSQAGYHDESVAILVPLIELVDGASQEIDIPKEFDSPVHRALWYSTLSSSASLSFGSNHLTLEASLKTLNQCCGSKFPPPENFGIGAVLKRAIKHLWLLSKSKSKNAFKSEKYRQTKESLELTDHAHLAFNTMIVLALLSTSNPLPPLYPVAILFEMLNTSIVIKDERPTLWINSAGNAAFSLAYIKPSASRMYLESAFSLAHAKDVPYPTLLIYTTLYSLSSIDGDGYDYIKMTRELIDYVNNGKYEYSVIQGLKLFESRIQFPENLEESEVSLLANLEKVKIEHALVAMGTVTVLLYYAMVMKRTDKIRQYLEKISQILNPTGKTPAKGLSTAPNLCVEIWASLQEANVPSTLQNLKSLSALAEPLRTNNSYIMVIETGLMAIWPLFSQIHKQNPTKFMFKPYTADIHEIYRRCTPCLNALGRGLFVFKPLSHLMWSAYALFKGNKRKAKRLLVDLVNAKQRKIMDASMPHIIAVAYAGLWLLSGEEDFKEKSLWICNNRKVNLLLDWLGTSIPF